MKIYVKLILTITFIHFLFTANFACGAQPGKSRKKNNKEYDVIIVGAGIAGLTSAYYLSQKYHIKVLEKNNRVGGRAVTSVYNGLSYAKGTEYLGKLSGPLKQIAKQLKVKPVQIPSPMDAHYFNNKFYYGDEGIALMFIRNSSLKQFNNFALTMLKYASQYKEIPELNLKSSIAELDNISTEQWFRKMKLPAIYYDRFNTASRGLFGANLSEISALSFIPEAAFDYEGFEKITDADDLTNKAVKGRDNTDSYTFKTGITEITNAIAKHLGSKIRLNSRVISVKRKNKRYIIQYKQNGKMKQLTAKLLILATPAPVTLKIAKQALTNEQAEILTQVPYANYITVALYSQTPIFTKAFDLAVPDKFFFTDVYDSTWVQKFYDRSLTNKKKYIVGVYIAPKSYKDKKLLALSDKQILSKVYKDLEKIFPGARTKVSGYDIHRFQYAYPIMTIGAYQRLTKLHRISKDPLFLAGDYMIYPTFEAAADSGYLAAEKAYQWFED